MKKTQYEIWFLTGSQTLYGDEALRQVDADSRVVADGFNASGKLPCTVVYRGTVKSSEEIVKRFREANAASKKPYSIVIDSVLPVFRCIK